jgi:hypothetical protein
VKLTQEQAQALRMALEFALLDAKQTKRPEVLTTLYQNAANLLPALPSQTRRAGS